MSVAIRKVTTALQREYKKAGGIRIDQAVRQAEANVDTLSEACLEAIDKAIQQVADMTADPARRPTDEELRRLHGLVNDMLGCCAPIDIPGLVDTLYAVGRLTGALIATDRWRDGLLTPAVNLLRLVRRGAVPPQDLKALIAGIDQCARRFGAPGGAVP